MWFDALDSGSVADPIVFTAPDPALTAGEGRRATIAVGRGFAADRGMTEAVGGKIVPAAGPVRIPANPFVVAAQTAGAAPTGITELLPGCLTLMGGSLSQSHC
jgi:hypothetical protein